MKTYIITTKDGCWPQEYAVEAISPGSAIRKVENYIKKEKVAGRIASFHETETVIVR